MANLTVFGTRPKDNIFLPQIPYSVRNDCSVGQWKIGEEDFIGNKLSISIIGVHQFFGSLGKTDNTQWLQVWFVPAPEQEGLPENTVCVTYLKTRSIAQLSQKITELMAAGEPALGIFEASFIKHSGELGTYYSVVWNWKQRETEPEKKQLEAIASFLKAKPNLIDMNTADRLICIDNSTPDEVQLLLSAARAEEEEKKAKK